MSPYIWADGTAGNTPITAAELNRIETALENKNYINVKDAPYNAVGNGVANDGTAISAAISAAISVGVGVYWPAGNYLTTAAIASLHTVRHSGTGIIKRGTDSFYPAPTGTQTNVLYVNSGGSYADTNDGLTAATAMKTLTYAVTKLPNYGPTLQGIWTFQLAAATYSERVIFPGFLDSLNAVTIKGPAVGHPSVPTAIFTQGYNNGAVAIKAVDRTCPLIVQDVLFTGYNGTSSSAGIQTAGSTRSLYSVNCHFTDCYWGITAQRSAYDVKGGIFTRCGFLGDTPNTDTPSTRNGSGGGTRSLMLANHSIGLQGSGVLTNGPYFFGCQTGVFAQESCTGHTDWVRFEDCINGISLNVNSRANCDGSSFKRNTQDLRLNGNSHVYVSADVLFGTGADESSNKIILAAGSQIVDDNRLFTNISTSYNTVVKVADTVFPGTSYSTTTASVFYTATLAATVWRSALTSVVKPRRITVKIFGEFTGTAGTKGIIVRLGTSNVTTTFTATEVGTFEAEATIYVTGTATQFMAMKAVRHLGANVRTAQTQATNALTANTNLTLEAIVGVATDAISVDVVDLSWG